MSDNGNMLERSHLPTGLKLALLWTSLMFLYIYNDYFSLYLPGTIASMAAGDLGPLGKASAGVLVGVSLLLAVPALMIFLSAALPAPTAKWLNVAVGALYTFVEATTLTDVALFYKIIVCLQIVLSALIIVFALRWPEQR